MNSLSRQRFKDQYSCLHSIAAATYNWTDEQWAAASQKDVFDVAMKEMTRSIGKTVNPSIMQTIIENLEKFQLPRNVQEQEHVIGQI
ncbi:hypothetical protein D3C75_605520 [compost metagenome]